MEIDVEQIMQEIRDKLKDKDDWTNLPSFESVPIPAPQAAPVPADSSPACPSPDGYAQEVDAMNRTWELVYAWPLSTNPIRRVFQRLIKRILKFLLIQLMWQQNEFNSHTVRAMNGTKGRIDDLTGESDRAMGSINTLTEKAAELERTTTELSDRFYEETFTVEALEAQLGEIVQGISGLEKRIRELENQLQNGK